MKLYEIDVGKKYKCDYGDGKQYFATVIGKNAARVHVKFGDVINKDGDPGDPMESLKTSAPEWVMPERIHEM